MCYDTGHSPEADQERADIVGSGSKAQSAAVESAFAYASLACIRHDTRGLDLTEHHPQVPTNKWVIWYKEIGMAPKGMAAFAIYPDVSGQCWNVVAADVTGSGWWHGKTESPKKRAEDIANKLCP